MFQCAARIGVDFLPIYKCSQSIEGGEYLKQYGIAQNREAPGLHFVPWITINGVRKNLITF